MQARQARVARRGGRPQPSGASAAGALRSSLQLAGAVGGTVTLCRRCSDTRPTALAAAWVYLRTKRPEGHPGPVAARVRTLQRGRGQDASGHVDGARAEAAVRAARQVARHARRIQRQPAALRHPHVAAAHCALAPWPASVRHALLTRAAARPAAAQARARVRRGGGTWHRRIMAVGSICLGHRLHRVDGCHIQAGRLRR